MASILRRRRRAVGDRQRGAIAVEAALVFPIILLLALGVIEWSLVLRDQIEVTSVARAGARTASSLAPLHPWSPPPTPFTRQVVDAMEKAATSLPRGSIDHILVYKAAADGKPLSGSFSCATADTTCDSYSWDPSSNGGLGDWVAAAGSSWTGSDINSCQGDPAITSVGVALRFKHTMLSGLFGSSRVISSYTVMRFEPQTPGRCRP